MTFVVILTSCEWCPASESNRGLPATGAVTFQLTGHPENAKGLMVHPRREPSSSYGVTLCGTGREWRAGRHHSRRSISHQDRRHRSGRHWPRSSSPHQPSRSRPASLFRRNSLRGGDTPRPTVCKGPSSYCCCSVPQRCRRLERTPTEASGRKSRRVFAVPRKRIAVLMVLTLRPVSRPASKPT